MILNKKTDAIPADAIYIGRGSRWGNPFPMKNGSDVERKRVIEAHRRWLWDEIKAGRVTLADLASLHGRDLVCFCAPKPCHGDTLVRAAAWAVNQLRAQAS